MRKIHLLYLLLVFTFNACSDLDNNPIEEFKENIAIDKIKGRIPNLSYNKNANNKSRSKLSFKEEKDLALQINEYINQGYEEIEIPMGNYKIYKTIRLKSDVKLSFDYDAIIRRDPSFKGAIIGNANTNSCIKNVEISGGIFYSNENNGNIIKLKCNNSIFENIIVENFRAIAFHLKGNNNLLQNLEVYGPTKKIGNKDWNGTGAIHVYQGKHNTIKNSILNSGDDGVAFQPEGNETISNLSVYNCTINSIEGASCVAGLPTESKGIVRDIIFNDIVGVVKDNALITIVNKSKRQEAYPEISRVRNITFKKISLKGEGAIRKGVAFRCQNGGWVSNIKIIDCTFKGKFRDFGLDIRSSQKKSRNNRNVQIINTTIQGNKHWMPRFPVNFKVRSSKINKLPKC